MRPAPKIVVGLRGTGRTHALITWLTHGHPVRGWPGWSRLLVVADPETVRRLPREFPDLQSRLHAMGNGGLGKLVVHVAEMERGGRGMEPGVEIALDDAEHLLGHPGLRALPRPSVIAITGEAVTPAELNAPSGMLTMPSPISMEQAEATMRRYQPTVIAFEEEQRYEPPLAARIATGVGAACGSVGPHAAHGWMDIERHGGLLLHCAGVAGTVPREGQRMVSKPLTPPRPAGPSVPPPECDA